MLRSSKHSTIEVVAPKEEEAERPGRTLSCSFRSKTSPTGFSTLFKILTLIYVALYSTILIL